MQDNIHHITNKLLQLEDLQSILSEDKALQLSDDSIQAIQKCRAYLDKKVSETKQPIYGVNTGFGSLCNHSISDDDLSQLQANLMMSHACGMGDRVPDEIVKLMLLLKIQSLSYGNSGVQLITVQRLVEMFNNNIVPVVFQQGSLGFFCIATFDCCDHHCC